MRAFLIGCFLCIAPSAFADVDYGGNVHRYRTLFDQYARRPGVLMLPTECYSACTIYLGLPRVCVKRAGTVYVHGAHSAIDGSDDPASSLFLLAKYNRFPLFAARVMRDHALSSQNYTPYSAAILHSDGVPYCD
jgi:hypothetical protein